MASEQNAQTDKELEDVLGDIKGDAESATEQPNLEVLKDRLDKLELLSEELGRTAAFRDELKAYVSDLKAELEDIRTFRKLATITSFGMSLGIFLLLGAVLIGSPDWFTSLTAGAQSTFLISMTSASIFLMTIILRGVYRTRDDRNKGDMLPEHLKTARVVLDALPGAK